VADSFVIYDIDSSVPDASSKEQGSALKTTTSHSVTVSGLDANTTYYYRVKSTRVNGGTTIFATINSFSTGDDPALVAIEEASRGGSGSVIIDKTDKNEPIITNLNAVAMDTKNIKISWNTDELATSFIEYGETLSFGAVYGEWSSTTNHEIVLADLRPDTTYYYRALSSDSWGNLGRSKTFTFSLSPGESEEEEVVEGVEENPVIEEPEEVIEEIENEDLLDKVTDTALDLLRKLFPEVSLNELSDEQLNSVDSLEKLSGFISAPILSGQPNIEVGATEATISWTTDIESNSQIAFAPNNRYNPNADEPYYQIVGDANEMTTEHEVVIRSLLPDTSYHFQLRSKPRIGPTALSRDYTFATGIETLSIVSFFTQIIDHEKVVFKWITNTEADSVIKFSPYHGNEVAVDEQKIVKDNANVVIHELTILEFEAGIYYDIELQSTDDEGNLATEMLSHFSTSEDDLPPTISHVKADSTVFLDRSNKTQTIIAWITNEPSTSQVFYQEGVHGSQVDLSESTDLNTNYTKEHVMVITKFKPGVVYSFRVASIDSGGNTSLSKTHTFMTAKQRESIIQIIIGIFEDTFGWVKKLM
jgi:chitodextrinase